MSAVKEAAEMLETALKAPQPPVWSTYRDPGDSIVCPAVVIGPPSLQWQTGYSQPTSARFIVYVVVDADGRALERLWVLVEEVGEVVDGTEAVVLNASPTAYPSGATELPAYELLVEVAL